MSIVAAVVVVHSSNIVDKAETASLAVSGRTLHDVPAQAPTAVARDAIVAIVDPRGVTTATIPVVDGSELKVLPKPHLVHS